MHTHSLLKTDKFDEKFLSNYSKLKHGSKTKARLFGKLVGESCINLF